MKVVCVGDCGIDHYLPANDIQVGGISANVARHARVQFPVGDEIVLVSCVGNDENAGHVLRAFSDTGIKCLVEELTGKTPVQLIEVEEDGERRFVGYDAGVLADLSFSK